MCMYEQICQYVVGIVSMCRYIHVFPDLHLAHTCTYMHIPWHSDIPTHTYRYCMSLWCNYLNDIVDIPTDLAPHFWHSCTYPQTGSLMDKHTLRTYWVCTEYMPLRTEFVPVRTQYVPSTYWVQGYARGIPRLRRRSDVTVLLLGLLRSTNYVHTWYGTVL